MGHFSPLRVGLKLGSDDGVPPLAESCREPSHGKGTSPAPDRQPCKVTKYSVEQQTYYHASDNNGVR